MMNNQPIKQTINPADLSLCLILTGTINLRYQALPMYFIKINIKVSFKESLSPLQRFTHIYNCDLYFIAANFILQVFKIEDRCMLFCHVLFHCLHPRKM